MKVLMAPMAAMAETSGPFSRAAALCNELIEKKHEVAFCAAEDINYKKNRKYKKLLCTNSITTWNAYAYRQKNT